MGLTRFCQNFRLTCPDSCTHRVLPTRRQGYQREAGVWACPAEWRTEWTSGLEPVGM